VCHANEFSNNFLLLKSKKIVNIMNFKSIKRTLFVLEIILLLSLSLAFLIDELQQVLPPVVYETIKKQRSNILGLYYGFLAYKTYIMTTTSD